MGHRNYLSVVPKKTYNKIKNLSVEEFKEYYNFNGDDFFADRSLFSFDIYNLGDTDFIPNKKLIKKFFKKNELNEFFDNSDMEFKLTSPEIIKDIIVFYEDKIKNYYNKMVMPFIENDELLRTVKTVYSWKVDGDKHYIDLTKLTDEQHIQLYQIIQHVKGFRSEWVNMKPYNLSDETTTISTSWKYEYAIFELVKIYKTFDWKRHYLIYRGS